MRKFNESRHVRHAAMERLRFIDSQLFWEARINRADLIEEFAISPAQAALDFRAYLERAGPGVEYDTRAKAYIAYDNFTPAFEGSDGRTKLAKLSTAGDPLTAALPKLERPLDAGIAGPASGVPHETTSGCSWFISRLQDPT